MSTPAGEGGVERALASPVATFKATFPVPGCTGPSGAGCMVALLAVLGLLVVRTAAPGLMRAVPGDAQLAACLALVALAFALRRALRPRVVRADLLLDPDRLLVSTDQGIAGLFVDEVRAWREEPGGWLRLVQPGKTAREDLLLPPIDPARRALLLEALARHGVPRVGEPAAAPQRAPLLTVDGGKPWAARITLALTLALLAALWAADHGVAELAGLSKLARAVAVAPQMGCLLFLPWLIVAIATAGRHGVARLHADRIAFENVTLAWADVAAYQVGWSRKKLKLITRTRPLPLGATLPTPTSAERQAVLDLVVARGVPLVARATPRRAPLVGERPSPAPLAVFEGARLPGQATDAGGLVVGLVFVGAIVAIIVGQLLVRALELPRLGPWTLIAALLAAGVVAILGRRWAVARVGRAELFRDRVVLRRGQELRTVFWDQLASFDDASSDVVRLHRRPRWAWLPEWLDDAGDAVPAREERDRLRLVETLLAAGLHRREETRRPVAASPPPPRLVARGGWRWPELVPLVATAALVWLVSDVTDAIPLVVVTGACVTLVTIIHLNPRRGRVTFREDRLERRSLVLAWDDVVGWVPETKHVRLVLRDTWVEAQLQATVPTPTPAAFEQVRALLLEKGVPEVVD